MGVEITGSKYENRRLSFSNTSSVSASFLPDIVVDVCRRDEGRGATTESEIAKIRRLSTWC